MQYSPCHISLLCLSRAFFLITLHLLILQVRNCVHVHVCLSLYVCAFVYVCVCVCVYCSCFGMFVSCVWPFLLDFSIISLKSTADVEREMFGQKAKEAAVTNLFPNSKMLFNRNRHYTGANFN